MVDSTGACVRGRGIGQLGRRQALYPVAHPLEVAGETQLGGLGILLPDSGEGHVEPAGALLSREHDGDGRLVA